MTEKSRKTSGGLNNFLQFHSTNHYAWDKFYLDQYRRATFTFYQKSDCKAWSFVYQIYRSMYKMLLAYFIVLTS